MSPAPGAELRKLPLIVALILVLVAVALELSSLGFLRATAEGAGLVEDLKNAGAEAAGVDSETAADPTLQSLQDAASQEDPPGLGISYLALIDGILAYTLGLMVLALFVPDHLQAKLQGILSLIGSILLIIGSIALIIGAIAKLLLMVGLFVAAPFGTLVYLAVWGSFPKGAAAAILAIVMLVKLAACVCLPLAHQRFLNNKGLIILILTSLLATLIVTFLHGIVPGPVVSITDAVAAIVVGILALIWAVVILVGSIVSVVSALTTS